MGTKMAHKSSEAERDPTSPVLWVNPKYTKGILSLIPNVLVPYFELLRFEQPHGNYMIYFPHLLGLIYASTTIPEQVPASTIIGHAGWFAVWTFFFRGAGCAWNDAVDAEYDKKTARCKTRPIARGAVTATQGYGFAAMVIGPGFASLQAFPFECTIVAIVSTLLAIIYPFGKRFTNFAQVILGSTLASTVVLASYSVGLPALAPQHIVPTVCISASIMFLVIFYDVIYSRQDTEDDLKSGVKGMAVLFRNHLEALLAVVAVTITGLLGTAGVLIGMGPYFFTFSVAGVSCSLLIMIALTRWHLLPNWNGHSGWFYALAIANLLGGCFLEYFRKCSLL
ncbi:Prenytransferase ascA [Paramyrothecium foliicola]|nr:Prenytransferase ascA [Paramyrothecium foliicola]